MFNSASSAGVKESIENIDKQANPANIGAREIGFGSTDVGKDGEHGKVSFVEISKIFAEQANYIFGPVSFDRVS